MTREQTLNQAKFMVCGERQQDYGSPEDNFSVIAEYWTTYLRGKCCSLDADICILPEDVAMMMGLMKVGRITTGTAKEDSFVDLAGYVACAAEIATKRESTPRIEEQTDKISEYFGGKKTEYAGNGEQM